MKFGDEFHKWAQTGSTIVQAVAVVFGVGFAVQQLQGQEWEQRHRQVEATMEQLKQLESDPVRTSYQAVLAWRDRVVPAPSAADFQRVSAPFAAFLSNLVVCVQTDVCDQKTAIDWMCPAAIDYFAEAVRADVHTDANEIMSRVARGDWAHISSMATICSGEARYTDEVRKLLTMEITMSMLAWDDAKRPRPPDERDELSHPSGR